MSEQHKSASDSKANVFKKWWFWIPVVLVFLFTIWLLSPNAENTKLLNVANGEQLVVSGVNLGIAQSAVDSTGEITNYDCLTLSAIATRNGGNFYSDSACEPGSIGFVAKKQDTAQSRIITLYPRTGNSILNCKSSIATFTFNKEQTELVSYTFEEGDCFQGSKLPISVVDVKTVEELTSYSEEYKYKQAE